MSDIPDDMIDWIKTISSDDKRPEIQRGIRAIQFVIKTRRDMPSAMTREEIGTIGFRYGHHHAATKTRKRSGHGLAHVIGSALENHRQDSEYPAPGEILRIIPGVIMDGEIKPAHSKRMVIEHKGHRVFLTKAGKHSTNWLFHAYKIYAKKTARLPSATPAVERPGDLQLA